MTKLITINQLCVLMNISRPTVYRKTREPLSGWPRPIHIGVNSVRFRLDDVEAFINQQMEAK